MKTRILKSSVMASTARPARFGRRDCPGEGTSTRFLIRLGEESIPCGDPHHRGAQCPQRPSCLCGGPGIGYFAPGLRKGPFFLPNRRNAEKSWNTRAILRSRGLPPTPTRIPRGLPSLLLPLTPAKGGKLPCFPTCWKSAPNPMRIIRRWTAVRSAGGLTSSGPLDGTPKAMQRARRKPGFKRLFLPG